MTTPPDMTENSDPIGGPQAPNQVFVLRLWRAEAAEWRGRVQHVNSGETRYFRAWPGLVAHLEALLAAGSATGNDLADDDDETAP